MAEIDKISLALINCLIFAIGGYINYALPKTRCISYSNPMTISPYNCASKSNFTFACRFSWILIFKLSFSPSSFVSPGFSSPLVGTSFLSTVPLSLSLLSLFDSSSRRLPLRLPLGDVSTFG